MDPVLSLSYVKVFQPQKPDEVKINITRASNLRTESCQVDQAPFALARLASCPSR